MTALAVLVSARALLALSHQWAQGAYAQTDRGREVQPWSTNACRWCLSGALKRASGHPIDGVGHHGEAVRVLLATNPDIRHVGIERWNDHPARTHADVLAALDRAIADETSRRTPHHADS